MNITVSADPIQNIEADALVFPAFEEGGIPEGIADPRVAELRESGEFTGKPLELAVLHGPSGMKGKRGGLEGAGQRASTHRTRRACTPEGRRFRLGVRDSRSKQDARTRHGRALGRRPG